MLVNIGMALAVAVVVWFAWSLVRFSLELRDALASAASGTWEAVGDSTISSKESGLYCREEIVLRHGEVPRVVSLNPQPEPDTSLVPVHVT